MTMDSAARVPHGDRRVRSRGSNALASAAEWLAQWPEALLACMVWLARYWRSPGFGLYEDDLRVVPTAVQMTARQTLSYVWTYIVNLYGHGRPLSDGLFISFSHLGWTIDGLWGMYVIGYLILLVNVVLLYRMLLRLGTRYFALVGALAYLLYAADTSQAYLNHSLGLQPSLTLLLLAIHCYLRRRYLVAYSLVFVILFAYETPFSVFLAAPLLLVPWSRKTIQRLLFHGMVLGAELGVVTVIRIVIGEGRVVGMSLSEAVKTPFVHMAEGPLVSLGTYLYRPVQWALSGDWRAYLVAILALPILFELLVTLMSDIEAGSPVAAEERRGAKRRLSKIIGGLRQIDRSVVFDGKPIGEWAQLAATGAAMLVLAYPLTYTVRAYAISGRDTRVHFAGVVGAGLLIAGCVMLVTWLVRSFRARRAFAALLAFFLAAMLGYGLVIQRDYVDAWAWQRAFWTALVPLVQDVQDGEVILVDPAGLQDTLQIGANTWALPRIFYKLFDFPETWQAPPRVFRLTPDWRDRIITGTRLFRLDESTTVAPSSEYGTVSSQDSVIILTQGGALKREGQEMRIQDEQVPLKPITASTLGKYSPGFLNPVMIVGDPLRDP